MSDLQPSEVSRRAFLQRFGALGLGIGAGLLGLPSAAARPADAAPLRLNALQPHVGSSFQFRASGVDARLRLISATPLAARSQSPSIRLEGFSLIFQARRAGDLPAGIYRVSHPSLGGFDLFVAPVGTPDQRRHEAVVTRLH